MSQACYLVLDQGGHSSRALVFDNAGMVLAQARVAVHTRYPHEQWVEQDPDELVASLQQAAEEAVASLSGDQRAVLRASALVTQRSSVVCWDRGTGGALYPVISWQDRRAANWLQQCGIDAAEVQARAGLRLSPHYGASKLRWCLQQVPAILQARSQGTLACGPLASFLVCRLLEERPCLIDPANAARTLLCNLHTEDWDPELLAAFDIDRTLLPKVVPTLHAYGTLPVAGQNVPLRLLNGDQSAAVFASGEVQPEQVLINAGTGAFLSRIWPLEQPVPSGLLKSIVHTDPHQRICMVEGPVNGAASALDWGRQQLAIDSLVHLSDWCAAIPEPPLFMNGVGGLGAPFWQPDFPSVFIGRGPVEAKMVAVVESIAFQLYTIMQCLMDTGRRPDHLVLTGGMAQLDGFARCLADLCDLPVWRPQVPEASARGGAWWLAGCPGQWPTVGCWLEPDHARTDRLQQRYQHWLAELQARLGQR